MSAALLINRRFLVLTTTICLIAKTAFGQVPDFSGRPVVELIEALRDQGTRIVYSEDLLPTRLRVTVSPTTEEPFAALREILRPHGLDLEIGPRETWLVVNSPETPANELTGDQALTNLTIRRPQIETVIVTTSQYSIARPTAISANTIGRHTLETSPALGQDPLRITQALPGVTGNQLSSRMHIRGGNLDEVLLRLDGVRLYSPYHLKDFQSVFSSINPRVIESMDVRTGGYDAAFGDRMSGVVDMTSMVPTEFRHHEFGVSLLETYLLSSGLFDNGRGNWVTSLRRGNLDTVSDLADSDIGTPQYVDFFNKLQYSWSPHWKIGTGILSLDDKITLNDGGIATAAADYDDVYAWISLHQSTESGLDAVYRISLANINRKRFGTISDPTRVTGSLAEKSKFDRQNLTADWRFPLSDATRLRWGMEIARSEVDHEFQADRSGLVPIRIDEIDGRNSPPGSAAVNLEQTQLAAYMSFRIQPNQRTVAELGVRWDDQSLIDAHQLSPRLNLLFDISDRTTIRAAWGQFDQSQSLDEIAVADGMISAQAVQESEHFVLGLEQLLGETITFRLETFTKNISRLNRRFENVFERANLIPELLPDRFAISPLSARVRGAEISAEGARGNYLWWVNLSRSRTDERLTSGKFRRSWDEQLSVKAGGEWSGDLWTVTAAETFRSGWPISTLQAVNDELISDSFNGLRLPDFVSFDIRASREMNTRRGSLNVFMEITNAFNHANYCCVEYEFSPGSGTSPAALSTRLDDLLEVVPNFGMRLSF